jgi:ankyrin repeat protein
MEYICRRFPVLGEMIFERVDYQTLTKCKEADRKTCEFLNNGRFLWVQMIRKNITPVNQYREEWKIITKKTPVYVIRVIAMEFCRFTKLINLGEIDLDQNGIAPLHCAVRCNLEVYKYMFEKALEKNPADPTGLTPLHLSASYGNLELCRFIIENVGNKNPGDSYGCTPFQYAAVKGRLEVCQLFLEILDDINPKTKRKGLTPFHAAADCGQLEVCKLMIQNGVNIDSTSKDNETALHMAAKNGHMDLCRFLIESGAEKNLRNNDDKSPLNLAAEQRHLKVVVILIENLAEENSDWMNALETV